MRGMDYPVSFDTGTFIFSGGLGVAHGRAEKPELCVFHIKLRRNTGDTFEGHRDDSKWPKWAGPEESLIMGEEA